MKIKYYEVKPIMTKFFCDCGGEMESTGMAYPVMPPIYEYKCMDCGKVEKTSDSGGIWYDIIKERKNE